MAEQKPAKSKTAGRKVTKTRKSRAGQREPLTKLKIAEAIEYRIQGYTYRQIADQMEISEAYAYKLVKAGLTDRQHDAVDDYVNMNVDRLEMLIAAQMTRALDGDDRAAETVIKLQTKLDQYRGVNQQPAGGARGSITVPWDDGGSGERTTKFEIEFVTPQVNDDEAA